MCISSTQVPAHTLSTAMASPGDTTPLVTHHYAPLVCTHATRTFSLAQLACQYTTTMTITYLSYMSALRMHHVTIKPSYTLVTKLLTRSKKHDLQNIKSKSDISFV